MHCMFFHINPILFNPKKGKELYHIIQKYNYNIEKRCGCELCFAYNKRKARLITSFEEEVINLVKLVLKRKTYKK